LSDAAICFGCFSVKTPRFRSSASLSRVTRCDHGLGEALVAADLPPADPGFRLVVPFASLPRPPCIAGLPARALFRWMGMLSLLFHAPVKNPNEFDPFPLRRAAGTATEAAR
jgi:hypothetical protein